ncbi:MAG: DUF2191 domain-containing protein [Gammaproteobacteria bacterium]|nr:DUF2191 domain-containing protein [Gammaproteobacteria bacterium]
MGDKKTTPDIHDALLDRAKRHAKKIVRPLRAVVEDGLRRILAVPVSSHHYQLPDLSVGDTDAADPFEAYSWQDLRGMMYEKPETG